MLQLTAVIQDYTEQEQEGKHPDDGRFWTFPLRRQRVVSSRCMLCVEVGVRGHTQVTRCHQLFPEPDHV